MCCLTSSVIHTPLNLVFCFWAHSFFFLALIVSLFLLAHFLVVLLASCLFHLLILLADAGPHVPLPEGVEWPAHIPHPVFVIGAHIMLMDCPLESGPTCFLPGSHRSGQFPPRNWDDALTYNGQSSVPCLARAGDVTLFVSDVWHRRMPTLPGNPGRYFLQVHYGRRDIAQRIQPTARVNHVTPAVIAQATALGAPELVGIHSLSFYDG